MRLLTPPPPEAAGLPSRHRRHRQRPPIGRAFTPLWAHRVSPQPPYGPPIGPGGAGAANTLQNGVAAAAAAADTWAWPRWRRAAAVSSKPPTAALSIAGGPARLRRAGSAAQTGGMQAEAEGGATQGKTLTDEAEGCAGTQNRDGGWAGGWAAKTRSEAAAPAVSSRDCRTEGAPDAASGHLALNSQSGGDGVRATCGGVQCGVGM